MNEIWWSALGLGFLGSLHCVGMCGPIAIALPGAKFTRTGLILSGTLYNFGRVLTYALLGTICGMIGQLVSIAGLQRWLSIGAGVLILLLVLLPRVVRRMNTGTLVTTSFLNRFRLAWGTLFRKHSILSMFGIGLLNGLLPCGLVYVALAAAIATGSAVHGAGYMALFGLGTFPTMLAMGLFGSIILPARIRQSLVRALPVGAAILALLLVMRGLSLGIPYLSPNLHERSPQSATQLHDCCK